MVCGSWCRGEAGTLGGGGERGAWYIRKVPAGILLNTWLAQVHCGPGPCRGPSSEQRTLTDLEMRWLPGSFCPTCCPSQEPLHRGMTDCCWPWCSCACNLPSNQDVLCLSCPFHLEAPLLPSRPSAAPLWSGHRPAQNVPFGRSKHWQLGLARFFSRHPVVPTTHHSQAWGRMVHASDTHPSAPPPSLPLPSLPPPSLPPPSL